MFQAVPRPSHDAGAVGSKLVRSKESKPPASGGAEDEVEDVAEIVGGGKGGCINVDEAASCWTLGGNVVLDSSVGLDADREGDKSGPCEEVGAGESSCGEGGLMSLPNSSCPGPVGPLPDDVCSGGLGACWWNGCFRGGLYGLTFRPFLPTGLRERLCMFLPG